MIVVRSILKRVLQQCRAPAEAVEADAQRLVIAIDNAPANDRYEVMSLTPGRVPAGFEPPPGAPTDDSVGAWFARAAAFERASVFSFELLARELRAHGAPDDLVRRALEAADDERVHDALMVSLAMRRGVSTRSIEAPLREPRSLGAMALENMTEGCVRETWSALVACWQAHHCAETRAATAFRAIADDEARHAQLAWDVAAWVEPRLDELTRYRIRRACDHTVTDVITEAIAEVDPALVIYAGLPSSDDALCLLAELDAQLWSHIH